MVVSDNLMWLSVSNPTKREVPRESSEVTKMVTLTALSEPEEELMTITGSCVG